MPGLKGRIVLQPRDRRLLSALENYRLLDRMQVMRVAPFTSVPRANARLLQLSQAGFLRRSFVGLPGMGRKAIYRLPRSQSVSGKLIPHQLALNAVRLAFGKEAERFRSFAHPPSPFIKIIPDGYLELRRKGEVLPLFLEIDLGTEPGKLLRAKAEGYLRLALSGEFERAFSHPHFRVVVVTTTERRARGIARAIHPVTDKLFFISTLSIINSVGPFDSIWLRPDRTTNQSLL